MTELEVKLLAHLRAWVAGCGDERYSTKEEVRELIEASGKFLAEIGQSPNPQPPQAPYASSGTRSTSR
jgi:hypothetical protein